MGRKKKEQKKSEKEEKKQAEIDFSKEEEKKQAVHDIKVRNIILVILALFIIISCLTLFSLSGEFGIMFDKVLTTIFGVGKWFLPIFLGLLFILYIKSKQIHKLIAVGVLLIFSSCLSFIDLFQIFQFSNYGGAIGKYFLFPFLEVNRKYSIVFYNACNNVSWNCFYN